MSLSKKILNNLIFNKINQWITFLSMSRRKSRFFSFDDSSFLRLNIGCGGRAFYSYINIDERRANRRVFVLNLARLPFKPGSAKIIILDHSFVKNKSDKSIKNILKELSRISVQAGILKMDNFKENENFSKLLAENGFIRISKQYNKLYSVASFISAPLCNADKDLPWLYYNIDGACIHIDNCNAKNKRALRADELDFDIERFDNIYLHGVLERIPAEKLGAFLFSLKHRMNNRATVYIECMNEQTEKGVNFFDKANLAQILTESDFILKRIELRGEWIYIEAGKEAVLFSLPEKKRRICAIGQYLMFRYNHLGFEWDSFPRAFERLGMDYLLIEGMRNQSASELQDTILSFKPDYILVILKETMPILYGISEKLRKNGTKIIFWFMDPVYPKEDDLRGIVDFMFLSNRGQIDEYKKAYNLERIFYMPQSIGEYAMYRRPHLKDVYDIGFSGAISREPLHKTRRELIEELKSRYNVKVRNDIRNNIAEFYAQSKTVLGVSDFDYELYTSNRFFVALGCGACYITKRFKGIELLAENKKHLLWFEDKRELFDLLDYYLSHDSEREKIRENAERLALDKHTCVYRVKNVLDIAEGKTGKFYGFL